MATSVYIYKLDDTLIKLADRFNTDVDTLVRLNSWLKDVNTNKTHIKLSDSKTIQRLDIVNAQKNNFSFTVTPKRHTISANCIYPNNSHITFLEDDEGKLVYNDVKLGEIVELGEIDYTTSSITIYLPFKDFKSIDIIYEQDYWPDRIILPIVANGNTSVEDYWDIFNDITGVQTKVQLENSKLLLEPNTQNTTIQNSLKLDEIFATDNGFQLDSNGISLPIHQYYESQKTNFIKTDDAFEPSIGTPQEDFNFAPEVFTTELGKAISVPVLDAAYNKNEAYKKYKHIKTCLPTETKMIITVGNNIIYLPIVPSSISDDSTANYSSQPILGSSEPFRIYTHTSQRSQTFKDLTIHRDMTLGSSNLLNNKMLERIAGIIQSGTYPNYDGTIAPLRTTVKVLNQDSISGIMTNASVEFSGPIMANVNENNTANWMSGKYSVLTISFTVEEVNTISKGASEILTRWTQVNNTGGALNDGVSIH